MSERTIRVPPGIEPYLDRLVEQAVRVFGEDPEAVREFIELAVLQRGIKAVQEHIDKDLDFGQRMGWPT